MGEFRMRETRVQGNSRGLPSCCVGLLNLLAGVLLVAWCASAEAAGPKLSEAEQLDLLAAADRYYISQERDSNEAIRMYEEVLHKVDLAEPIRQEILFNVAGMYLYDCPPGSPTRQHDLARAAQHYQTLIDDFPSTDWRVFQAHIFKGDTHAMRGEYDAAQAEYLWARRIVNGLTDKELAQLSPQFSAGRRSVDTLTEEKVEQYSQWPKRASRHGIRNMVDMHSRRGPDGLEVLKRLARDHAYDPELADMAREAIARYRLQADRDAVRRAEQAQNVAAVRDLIQQALEYVAEQGSPPAPQSDPEATPEPAIPRDAAPQPQVQHASTQVAEENRIGIAAYAVGVLLAVGGLVVAVHLLRPRNNTK